MQLSAQISEKWIKKRLLIFKEETQYFCLSCRVCPLSLQYIGILLFEFWFQRKVKHILDLCVNVFVILFFGLFLFCFVWIGFWYCLKWFGNYFKIAGHGLRSKTAFLICENTRAFHVVVFLFCFHFTRHHAFQKILGVSVSGSRTENI